MDPDYDVLQDEVDRLRRESERKNDIIDRLREQNSSSYSEGGTSWQKWILGILALLAVAGVVGGIEGFGQLQSIHQQQVDAILAADDRRHEIDRRLENIERKLEQRVNGS